MRTPDLDADDDRGVEDDSVVGQGGEGGGVGSDGGGSGAGSDPAELGGATPEGAAEDEASGKTSRNDWDRYGLGSSGVAYQPDRGRPAVRRRSEPRDDSFLDYRRENVSRGRAGTGHSSRFTANAIGAVAVGVTLVLLLVVGLVTSGPAPTPTPPISPTPIAISTPTPAPTPAAAQNAAQVESLVDLPFAVGVADRAQPPDNGAVIFLTGGEGGVAVDPQTGAVGTVFGGEAFAVPVRRTIVATGSLWVSTWPQTFRECGPDCWNQANTYRLNVGTGKVQQAYPATYLVGLGVDGLWLASGDSLQRLDLGSGTLAGVTPWKQSSEPRVGCLGLWSYDIQTGNVILSSIDASTGEAPDKPVVLPGTATYGPVAVGSACWMMSGYDGATGKAGSIFQIPADGAEPAVTTLQSQVLLLDGEFWTYSPGGVLQRYQPVSDISYGRSYRLSPPPSGDDAGRLFAAMGKLWMVEGQTLVGFNVLLGVENSTV